MSRGEFQLRMGLTRLEEGPPPHVATSLLSALPSASDAEHSLQASARHARQDEDAGEASFPGIDLRQGTQTRPLPGCAFPRALPIRHAVPGGGPRGNSHLPLLSYRTPQAYPDHQSPRAASRREPTSLQGAPAFPSEASCLTLMYTTLITTSRRWRGVRMTIQTLRQLDCLRAEMAPSTWNEAA